MASSPILKVYSKDGEYLSSCKYPIHAAAILVVEGNGSTIRNGHRCIIYTQGIDGDAGNSYDAVADVCRTRINPS